MNAAFDLIEERIAGFGDGDTIQPPAAEEAIPAASPAPPDEAPAAAAQETVQTATAPGRDNDEAAIANSAWPAEAALPAAGAVEVTAEVADAHDDAVLDMIALEMAAPDVSDTGDTFEIDTDEIHVAELAAAEPEIIAQEPKPPMSEPLMAEPVMAEPLMPEPMAAAASPAIQPSLQPLLEPSLGSSLIANGIVRRPNVSASDPLAPIRRMSQAEKIAFFS